MSDLETMRTEIRKLSAKAMQAKMDLHDLSEELPLGLENVTAVARRVVESYEALEAAKMTLKALETAP